MSDPSRGFRLGLSVLVAILLAGAVSAAAAARSAPRAPAGLPAGVAAAALRGEPRLPVPSGWPFPDAFSRTSGTGRLIRGAFEWTDWVFDDYGESTAGPLPLNSITSAADALSPARGDDVYPAGAADDDGADIFRAAVGLTRTASIWRVDWNTLADPRVPIAEWTFDTDDDARTGASTWPAAANVSSPGIERALVVSARGAQLIDAVSGRILARFRTRVGRAAQSFIVWVPRRVLPVRGRWRIRLAAGLADAAGTGFAVPTLSGGAPASSTAPRVYNITFRTAAQEPASYSDSADDAFLARLHAAVGGSPVLASYSGALSDLVTANFWSEDDQADTLATGDVSRFSAVVNWRALARRRTTAPPLLRGWSDRWYVTGLDLGQGVSPSANPAFLSRVQPYAVYVPTGASLRAALPLTWTLHSADVDYNQYGAINPRLVAEVCQARETICASPEGFGGDGLYVSDAENDFWQVWRQLALAFRLSADRTVVTGYSMGGLASFVLPSTYPSVFSEAMPLDGGFDEACSTAGTGGAQLDIAAAPDRAANVRWVPLVISDSLTDELSPYPEELDEISRLQSAGDRFTFFSTTTPEHVTTDLADGFATQVAALHGTPVAVAAPGTIDYTWCPQAVSAHLGLGPTSLYWLSGLSERTTSAGTTSRIVADDGALPTPAEAEHVTSGIVAPPDGPPMEETSGTWAPGPTPAPAPTLTLTLTNVAALSVDARAARLPAAGATVTSDGATVLTLLHLARGTVVRLPAGTVRVGRAGRAVVRLGAGTTSLSWSPAG